MKPLSLVHQRRIQLSLRGLLLITFLVSIVALNWRFFLAITSGFFWPTWLLVLFVGFSAGRNVFRISPRHTWSFRLAVLLLLTSTVVTLSILAWARMRWFAMFDDSLWPRPLPYPDTQLMLLHDWMDAAFPVPPGVLKIDGEFYAVLITLNFSIWGTSLLCSFLLGVLAIPNTTNQRAAA